jgi:hypothetical protein
MAIIVFPCPRGHTEGRKMKTTSLALAILGLLFAGSSLADWSDNFDSYSPGGLHGLGGWAGWGGASQFDAVVTDSISVSPSNSVKIIPTTDIIHEFDESSGRWLVTAMVFIPSGGSGDQFFIMHNAYTPGGSFECAHDLVFRQGSGTYLFAQNGATGSLILDQWVEIAVEIDLDGNTQEAFYNGTSLGSAVWASSGPVEIATIDLFSYNASSVFYDDLGIVSIPGTYNQISWALVKLLGRADY